VVAVARVATVAWEVRGRIGASDRAPTWIELDWPAS
jgi:hypothetical protein